MKECFLLKFLWTTYIVCLRLRFIRIENPAPSVSIMILLTRLFYLLTSSKQTTSNSRADSTGESRQLKPVLSVTCVHFTTSRLFFGIHSHVRFQTSVEMTVTCYLCAVDIDNDIDQWRCEGKDGDTRHFCCEAHYYYQVMMMTSW